ncbi:MAG: glycosyltransferase, partial [Proteobacteria bacterium]|nr:glycosyltransferase [Pseudomonadota bacterium]
WLVGADALLLPTQYDPAANATMEAMACAIPPVTTFFDGNKELVPDEHLIIDEPLNVEQCATALEYAWSNQRRLGEECRRVVAQWPVSRNGEAMESIYQELVNGKELVNG